MTITVGQSLVNKQGMSVGTQMPIAPAVEASYTEEPVHVAESGTDRKVLTHRHFGHPEEHPVTLRHRKGSADPMHGEEDKLIDEYKDLYDKAKKGECNPLEMKRIQELRGRLQEIQATRESDARRILGDDLLETADSQGGTFSLKPRPQPVKPPASKPSGGNLLTQTASARSGKTFKGDVLQKAIGPGSEDGDGDVGDDGFYGDDVASEGGLENTISWSLDAAIMVTDSIMKAHRGEPPYPADVPEDYGIHGSMTDPASGEVASDVQHSGAVGPYSGDVTSGSVARKADKPKGWTGSSSKKFWESVSEKGPHTECVQHVGGNVDDPHAFCAWAEHEGTGHWPGERRGKADEEKAAGDHYLKPGEQPPQGAKVQQGPRGGKFIPGGGPATDEEMAGAPDWVRRSTHGTPENQAAHAQGAVSGPALNDAIEDVHSEFEPKVYSPEGERAFKAATSPIEREWRKLAMHGDLGEDDWEGAVPQIEEFIQRNVGGHHPKEAVRAYAEELARDLIQPLLVAQEGGGDDEWPGPWNEDSMGSRGRMDRAVVSVHSSANMHKGAAFVQRPIK